MKKIFISEKNLVDATKVFNQYIKDNSVSTDNTDLIDRELDEIENKLKNLSIEDLGGVEEAPQDGFNYVRHNGKWVRFINIPIDKFPKGLGCNCDHSSEVPDNPDIPEIPNDDEDIAYYAFNLSDTTSLEQIYCVNKCLVEKDDKGAYQVKEILERCRLDDSCYVMESITSDGFSDYTVNSYLDKVENTLTVMYNITGEIPPPLEGHIYQSAGAEVILYYYKDDNKVYRMNVSSILLLYQ